MKKKYNNRAINCDPSYGPIFGNYYGCDIFIDDNCNRDEGGWTNYGNSSYEYDSSYRRSLFVNTDGPDQRNYFKVSDYEVFTYN